MKSLAFAVAVAFWSIASVAQTCVKMEYAQLKDSTRKELTDEYCLSIAKAELHDKLGQSQLDLFNSGTQTRRNSDAAMQSFKQHSEEQVACLRQAEAASSMMQKKFKAKPTCKG